MIWWNNITGRKSHLILAWFFLGFIACSDFENTNEITGNNLFQFNSTNWIDDYACYRTTYSKAHLLKHPNQQVSDIALFFKPDPDATIASLNLGVKFRNTQNFSTQSENTQKWTEETWLPCGFHDQPICSIASHRYDRKYENDGGFAVVKINADKSEIIIETSIVGAKFESGNWLGNENNCLETGEKCVPTRYKLYKRPISECPEF